MLCVMLFMKHSGTTVCAFVLKTNPTVKSLASINKIIHFCDGAASHSKIK